MKVYSSMFLGRYNPYEGLTQISYNPTDERIYFFDSGKLLSVNVRMELDYYDEQEEILMQ
ncbi:unnamed protein product [Meloidogyne enterolobii]|uniref:Uncharacterized protein n=1 Tax=Meloidogyne enterolobii TaxID=390850 RepID=A0ACB0ZM03_MELEN